MCGHKLLEENMKIAVAGSFDPMTNGHMWVITEALSMADEVVVMVASNPNKKYLFSDAERVDSVSMALFEAGLSDRTSVKLSKSEYVAQAAKRNGCAYLMRGIRNSVDFEYESLLQKTNSNVLEGAKTLFVMPPKELESVSSSFIKALSGPPGWHMYIEGFVPHVVYGRWVEKEIVSLTSAYFGRFGEKMGKIEAEDFAKRAISAYSEAGRIHHGVEHLLHCLQELDSMRDGALNEDEELAAFLAMTAHDAIYVPGSASNEVDSARWMSEAASLFEIEDSIIEMATSAIMATRHSGRPCGDMEARVVDADMSILGQSPAIYEKYSKGIRSEYSKYSDDEYRIGRIDFLKKALSSERIFWTDGHMEKLEAQARANMEGEILKLERK